MKKIIFLFAILLAQPVFGFYAGVGFGWNTVDESFRSNLHTNENKSGKDRYETHQNRLTPTVKVGHEFCFCENWLVGLSAEWKYLNYKTPNMSSSRGQILPNATFSSINIFGDDVKRDFTSRTRLNNEVMLLAYLGREVICGYAYLGLGPAFFDSSNRIYVSSVHTPNGVGDHLISTSVKRNKIIWGGAAQIGYQYYLCQNTFINVSYTYLQTGRYRFKNSANAARLNGSDIPGPTTLFLKRSIKLSVQEFIVSMNLAF